MALSKNPVACSVLELRLKAEEQYQAGPNAVQIEWYSVSKSASWKWSNEQALADNYVHILRTNGSNGVVQCWL